ncbi:MAG: ribonuclease Z [Aridibacter sp.]
MSQRRFIALGTASQVPTRSRNHNGYFLRWDAEGFLFDPGEGTQRQMIRSGVAASDITKIFITHFHGDHCLGLAGVLQRLSLDRIPHTVQIFYPKSGQKFLNNLKNASIYHQTATIEEHPISKAGIIFEDKNLTIETHKLEHSAEGWGYRINEKDSVTMLPEKLKEFGIFRENIGKLAREGFIKIDNKTLNLKDFSVAKKGQTFAFVMDTRICKNAYKLAENADLLVIESTYLKSETDEAIAHGHLTATQAAEIARDANVKELVLTHFSQRYQNIKDFLNEAKLIYKNTVAVKDGDFVDLPKRK